MSEGEGRAMEPKQDSGRPEYRFSWTYSREEIAAIWWELHDGSPEVRSQRRQARSDVLMGSLGAVFFLCSAGVIGVSAYSGGSRQVADYWPSVAGVIMFVVLIHLVMKRWRPFSKSRLRLRADAFTSDFQATIGAGEVVAAITPADVWVRTNDSERRVTWSGVAHVFHTPSAVLLYSPLNEWLLCLPRRVIDPQKDRLIESDLARWQALARHHRIVKHLVGSTLRCLRCGYDLKGVAKPVCPECGKEVRHEEYFR